jgi:hypothetical protein
MFMKEPDSLDALLREWKSPDPAPQLDRSVITAYRSTVRPPRPWRQFWTMRISIPAPALLAAALAIAALLFWLRPSPAPKASTPATEPPSAVTQLDARGFQPLPNGEAKIIQAKEIQK